MTQDEIIRMAREAGILEPIDLLPSNQWRQDTIRELERFAALVAEAERKRLNPVVSQAWEEGYKAAIKNLGGDK